MTYSTDNARNFFAALAISLIAEVFSLWRWSPALPGAGRLPLVAPADAAHAGALFVFGYLAAAPFGATP